LFGRISPYTRSRKKKAFNRCLPFGNAKNVLSLENVNWFVIENTSDPVLNCDLVVTDLRVNLTDEWDRQVSDYALSGVRVLHYKHLVNR
jgi:hypothetical protein